MSTKSFHAGNRETEEKRNDTFPQGTITPNGRNRGRERNTLLSLPSPRRRKGHRLQLKKSAATIKEANAEKGGGLFSIR